MVYHLSRGDATWKRYTRQQNILGLPAQMTNRNVEIVFPINESIINAFIQAPPEIIVVSEKIDDGYSGLFLDRPAFKELIEEIESGVVNCVIVKDLSRLSRDYIETGRYLRDFFPAHGVRFISVDDNIDSTRLDGFDKTIALLKSIFSEQYSHDVPIKTRSSLGAKRRQGKYVGAVPVYGYQKSVDSKHQLVPDPNTADVVQSIFHMKLQGMSAAKIASILNKLGKLSPLSYKREHGWPHPTGGYAEKNNALWSATTVLRILRDETYSGTLVQGRQRSFSYKTKTLLDLDENEWVKTEYAHPAIICRADYETVQRTLAIDTRTAPNCDKVHIFSGILICGCCGRNMTRKAVKNKGHQYIYYYCPTGKRNGCLTSATFNEKDLQNAVTHKVRDRIAEIEKLSAYISKKQMGEIIRDNRKQQIAAYDIKIQDLHRYKLHLHTSKTKGFIEDTELQTLQGFYDAEISRLDAEVSVIYKELQHSGHLANSDSEWNKNFLQFTNMQELDRLAVVKMIQSIRILSTKELIINFVYQSEYEQLVQCSRQGGRACGKKESQTK